MKKRRKEDHKMILDTVYQHKHILDNNGLFVPDAGDGKQRLRVRTVERECAMTAQQTAGTVDNSCVRFVEADINVLHLHVHTHGNRLQKTQISKGR